MIRGWPCVREACKDTPGILPPCVTSQRSLTSVPSKLDAESLISGEALDGLY